MVEINKEEWYAEFEKLSRNKFVNDEGMTSGEIREMLGLPIHKHCKFLKQGVLLGKLQIGKRQVSPDWDGRTRIYTVYKLVK